MLTNDVLFSERVQSSRTMRIVFSVLAGFILSLALFYPVLHMQDRTPSALLFLLWVGLVFILYVVLSLTYGVKIRLYKHGQHDGQDGFLLHIHGTSHSQGMTISSEQIDGIEKITMDESIWRSLLDTWFDPGDSAYVLRQLGYRGAGLAVTYHVTAAFSGNNVVNVVHFPTRKAKTLQSLLVT